MSEGDSSWKQDLVGAMAEWGDPGPVLKITAGPRDFSYEKTPAFDEPFDHGYGGARGCSFTAWTEQRVYFPVEYDGSEWIGSVPRNPCDEATPHQGGG